MFALLMLSMLLFFLCGKWLLNAMAIYNSSFYRHLFFATLTGVLVFTISTAIYFTHGKSSLVIALVFLFIIRSSTKPSQFSAASAYKINFKRDFKEKILPLFLSLILLFIWFGRLILDSQFAITLPANPETILYAQFSKVISNTGIESTFGIGFLPHDFPKSISPYHYFDLWFTSGISHLFGRLTLEVIHFFTLPTFNFLNVLGLCAFAEIIGFKKFYTPLLALLSLFFTACYFFPFAEEFGRYNFDFLEAPLALYGEKLSFAFTLFIAIALLYFMEQRLSSLLLILIVPLLFPTLLLPIFIGVLIFCFIGLVNKTSSKSEIKKVLLLALLLLLFFYLFYHFYGNNSISLQDASDFKGVNFTSFKMIVAETFYRSWNKPFRTALLYLPFIILLFVGRKKLKFLPLNQLLILALCVYVGALISWAILYKLPEAWQIYTNALVLLHLVFMFYFLQLLTAQGEKIKSVFVSTSYLFLLFLSVYFSIKNYSAAKLNNSYSTNFLNDIKLNLAHEKNDFVVAYLKNADEYNSMSELSTGGLTASYLQLQRHFYGMVNIGFYNQLEDSSYPEKKKSVFKNQNFYHFVNQEIAENKFNTVSQSQVNFLHLNHIQYLAASAKTSIPEEIIKITRIQFTDQVSGEKFLVLDNSATFK